MPNMQLQLKKGDETENVYTKNYAKSLSLR